MYSQLRPLRKQDLWKVVCLLKVYSPPRILWCIFLIICSVDDASRDSPQKEKNTRKIGIYNIKY